MITMHKDISFTSTDGTAHIDDIRCLSTDAKPTDVPNASTCLEIDTGKLYMFDAEGGQWHEI